MAHGHGIHRRCRRSMAAKSKLPKYIGSTTPVRTLENLRRTKQNPDLEKKLAGSAAGPPLAEPCPHDAPSANTKAHFGAGCSEVQVMGY
jgi:hypothetical protein